MINYINSHKADVYLVIMILFCAILLRVPSFEYPDSTVLDEGVSVLFTTTTVNRVPFFEPSPPLSWMIYRVLVSQLDVGYPMTTAISNNWSFFDFPYKQIRLAEVYIGSILVLLIYLVSRLLGAPKYLSASVAFLAIIESTLITYSRTIAPDGFLLFFGMLGILTLLISIRLNRWFYQVIGLSAGGFILGLSGSVKWNGFGFLAAGLVLLILKKRWKFTPVIFLSAVIAYFATFYFYFGMMNSGPVNMARSIYQTENIKSFYFPGNKSGLAERLDAAIEYSRIAYITHAGDEGEIDRRVKNDTGSVYRWPFSMSNLMIWYPGHYSRFMVLHGNPLVWSIGLVSFVIVFLGIIRSLWTRAKLDFISVFLVISYLGNYLPFTLVTRHLFMYSYIPSLLFSLLMLPKAFEIVWPYLEVKLKHPDSEPCERLLFYVFVVLGSLIFLSLSPMTYGY